MNIDVCGRGLGGNGGAWFETKGCFSPVSEEFLLYITFNDCVTGPLHHDDHNLAFMKLKSGNQCDILEIHFCEDNLPTRGSAAS